MSTTVKSGRDCPAALNYKINISNKAALACMLLRCFSNMVVFVGQFRSPIKDFTGNRPSERQRYSTAVHDQAPSRQAFVSPNDGADPASWSSAFEASESCLSCMQQSAYAACLFASDLHDAAVRRLSDRPNSPVRSNNLLHTTPGAAQTTAVVSHCLHVWLDRGLLVRSPFALDSVHHDRSCPGSSRMHSRVMCL